MPQLPEDGPTINVVKQHIVLVGLVREPLVINKDISQLTVALVLGCNADGGASWLAFWIGCGTRRSGNQ